jgi:hypothetical protein
MVEASQKRKEQDMGLDMYLTGEKFLMPDYQNPGIHPQEDGFRVRSRTLELGYWRKHPNLHGYIVQTFADGKDECQTIHLDPDDIRTIVAAVQAGNLPCTTGFFFGSSDTSPERIAEDIRIFEKALAWLQTEESPVFRSVIYRASW